MPENDGNSRPVLWLVDSAQGTLEACAAAFAPWADCRRSAWDQLSPDWGDPPDAVFFSAEIPGGAGGAAFTSLVENAGPVPLLAVARLRSLAQALAYFRAGAADYLSLPLEAEEARERFEAGIERAGRLAAQHMIMEVSEEAAAREEEEDILAQMPPEPAALPEPPPEESAEQIVREAAEWLGATTFVNDMPLPLGLPEETPEEPAPEEPAGEPDDAAPVDGLPIPSLWEELPCGLLVFDSLGNLVFSNRPGLELFGADTLADLQDALENGLAAFAAHGSNRNPLPDNQWPHVLAVKTRTPRSAVVSVEKRDRRRAWLRIDCQPHLADGKIARLSMTVVNLTGELPPLRPPERNQPKRKKR